MNFCPLCCNCLLLEQRLSGYEFYCRTCDYAHWLDKKKEIVQQVHIVKDQTIHDLSLQDNLLQKDNDIICPACEGRGAYVRLEQDRSLDEGQTHHYKCMHCNHTWKEIG